MLTNIGGRYEVPGLARAAGATTLDLASCGADALRVTMTGNCTFSFKNGLPGMEVKLLLVQDATGSRTGAWASNAKFTGGVAPTLTLTALHGDLLSFWFDGTNFIEMSRSLDVGVV